MNNKNVGLLLICLLVGGAVSADPILNKDLVFAQNNNDEKPTEPPVLQEEPVDQEARAKKTLEAEEKKQEEKEAREKNAIRGTRTTTEYTLDPGSVEMVVELDPASLGFRVRNHRMSLDMEFDPLFSGRSLLKYDFRFFEHLSVTASFGCNWTALSLYSKFSELLDRPSPEQFAIVTGLSAKWRVTEWYMRSSVFVEPSLLFGPMWQTWTDQDTQNWRVRPGAFVGLETVFDSGFLFSTKLGAEYPFDFGEQNPIPLGIEPLTAVTLGYAW